MSKRKIVGINIDGVIRDYIKQFEKVYMSTYISNPSIVETSSDFKEVRILTEEEQEEKYNLIDKLVAEKISKPIDTVDLMNHFKFEEGLNFMGEEMSAEEVFKDFMYETKSFQIFSQAPLACRSAMESANRIQSFGMAEDLFDVCFFSTLKNTSVNATYSFLAQNNCRIRNVKFLENHYEKWDHCDVLIDVTPEALQGKPEGKLSIKIETDYNQWDEADISYKDIDEGFKKEVEDPENGIITFLKEYFKKS